ncbi:MAG: DUF3883 domain-containing protein, partial [Leadbetterella sp.]|nr:DUF3883 domain-containing protein [Leadbetterella sp.]
MKRFFFCNTGWMNFYKGLANDPIKNGGEHVRKYGWGGEIFNFEEVDGKHYGYVEAGGTIHIERLGAKSDDNRLDDVTVVWTATHPEKKGTYIVGWYKNATLFRERQMPAPEMRRTLNGQKLDYHIMADINNCKLLSPDKRILKIPRKRHGMGEKNIWYADTNPSFISIVSNFIINDGLLPADNQNTVGRPRQLDPLIRLKVEKIAIEMVTEHYSSIGYQVKSVEKDSVGWDLNAVGELVTLKLEVKGLSGTLIVTELTPNELKNLNAYKEAYRLCIVTEALTNPQ